LKEKNPFGLLGIFENEKSCRAFFKPFEIPNSLLPAAFSQNISAATTKETFTTYQ